MIYRNEIPPFHRCIHMSPVNCSLGMYLGENKLRPTENFRIIVLAALLIMVVQKWKTTKGAMVSDRHIDTTEHHPQEQ